MLAAAVEDQDIANKDEDGRTAQSNCKPGDERYVSIWPGRVAVIRGDAIVGWVVNVSIAALRAIGCR
jgi:hypothetical protein